MTTNEIREALRGRPRCQNVDEWTDAQVRTVGLLEGVIHVDPEAHHAAVAEFARR